MKHQYALQRILDHYGFLKPEDVIRRLRYSTFVSLPKRFMYFEVPKAACTKMKELLRTLEQGPSLQLFAGDLLETRRDMFIHARQNVPLPSLVDLDDQTQKTVLESPDFLRFTFVRNPYTRVVSAWKNKVMLCEPGHENVYRQIKGALPPVHRKSLITFREFIDYISTQCDLRTCNLHWRLQNQHLFLSALDFSFIGKIEQMADGLHRFAQHLELSDTLVGDARNVSHASAGSEYDKSLADKVFSLYQSDFEAFGYDREAWPAPSPESGEKPKKDTVSLEVFSDEIIERNLIISLLYEERNQLREEVRKASRLRLLPVANGLIKLRNKLRRAPKP
jgi:Sulfotransferase family